MSTAPSDSAAWQRLAPYLDRALDLDPGERERWLADIAATEPQVATEVRRFLQEHVELDAKGFLEHSPIVSTQASIEPLRRAERILSSSPFPVDQRRIKAHNR